MINFELYTNLIAIRKRQMYMQLRLPKYRLQHMYVACKHVCFVHTRARFYPCPSLVLSLSPSPSHPTSPSPLFLSLSLSLSLSSSLYVYVSRPFSQSVMHAGAHTTKLRPRSRGTVYRTHDKMHKPVTSFNEKNMVLLAANTDKICVVDSVRKRVVAACSDLDVDSSLISTKLVLN